MPTAYELQRRLLLRLSVVAVACVAAQALTGIDQLSLWLTPLLLLAALLLSGRYVGEERILALRERRATATPRATRSIPRPPATERALASLLERVPALRRGPPARAAIVA